MSLDEEFKTVEELSGESVKLVEVELMLTPEELKLFAAHCIKHELKFNDWIRKLAYENIGAC